MKRVLLSVLAILIVVVYSNAQILVQEGTISMSQGLQNGFSVNLPGGEVEELGKMWVKHLKEYKGKKAKYNKKTNEYFANNLKIEEISKNTVDVYAVFAPVNEGVRAIVWYDMGGAYLNSEAHGNSAIVGQKIVYDFAAKVKRKQAKLVIEGEEEKLKGLEKDMEKLGKDEADIKKSIEELKAKLDKLQERVKNNKTAQSSKQEEVSQQKAVLKKAKITLEKIK
ncbi:MAG: hypothetical protein ACPG19_02495 [Saprospiraceae bacterium]